MWAFIEITHKILTKNNFVSLALVFLVFKNDNYKLLPWLIHFLQSKTHVFTSVKLGLDIFNLCKLVPSLTWKDRNTLNEIPTQPRNPINLVVKHENNTKNPDLSLFCKKSLHFLFLQNWILTFQYSAKLVPCMAWKTKLFLMKPQLSQGFSWSLLSNTKCPFLFILFFLDF